MKKFSWILMVIAIAALALTGCPGGGDDEVNTEPLVIDFNEVFSATVDTDDVTIVLDGNSMTVTAGNNPKSSKEMNADLLTGTNTFDASAFKGVRFEYLTTKQANIGIQDSVDPNSMWLFNDWGTLTVNDGWAEVEYSFAADLMKGWGNSNAFEKSKLEKIWIGLGNQYESTTKFEIRDFVFIR